MAKKRYEKRLAQAVIKQAIKDAGSCDQVDRYVASGRFEMHRKAAGYPPGLIDSLRELCLMSYVPRRFAARKILKALKRLEE